MARKRYSPKLKFQVVLEALTGEKTPGQIAKQYGIHPKSVGLWKKQFLERGAEIFTEDDSVQEYERRLADLEQLLGKKEVEIALLRTSWAGTDRAASGKWRWPSAAQGPYGLAPVLASLELPRSTWYYHQRRRVSYSQKYRHLRERLEAIARRKAKLIPIVDHATKLVLGWAVGEHAVTELALAAWDRARQTLRSHAVHLQRVIVHHDQDPSSPAMAGPPGSC